MDWKELPWEVRVWLATAFGIILAVVIAVALIGGWLREWWVINLVRNRLEAKRRLRREGRREDRP